MTREGDKPGAAELPTLPQQDPDTADTVPSAPDLASAETQASAPDLASAETQASDAGGSRLPAQARPPSGRFGEFQVLEKLGSGGMGEVFAAHDPNLDRRVAIKVLRADVGGSEAQERLLREAQAMAQLSHPNVITVHQVGIRAGQVFVVMEYVDGGTLRDWLDARPRSWREVLEVFTGAGRGLAAAHEAGLIHRDFKPDNVLIGSDGRVMVTDFGLVAATGADLSSPGEPGAKQPTLSISSSSRLAVELTRAGAVMGTPLYMAPEQHRGERADARADQFAFCVALFEALYGERPFTGSTYIEVKESVLRGEPCAVTGSEVPRRLHDLVARGLRSDRDERHPDMERLLEQLQRDPSAQRRRRLVGLVLGVVLVGLVASAALLWPAGAARRCQAAGDGLAEVWNDEVRAALRQKWSAGRRRVDPVIRLLDGFGAAWARERRSACEATYVRGEQSEQLLDRRMLCLDRRLGQMRALVEGLRSADPTVAHAAVLAAVRLPRMDECRDREALADRLAPPSGQRKAIEAVWTGLDRADALRALGKHEEAGKRAATALGRAKKIGFAPLLARAHYVVGFIAGRRGDHASAERHLREAIRQAGAGRAHHQEAEAWLTLIYLVGHETGRPVVGLALAPAAEAAVARISHGAALRGRLEGNLGLILLTQGDFTRARTRLERSLKIFEQAYGPDDLDTATARNNLALLLEKIGRPREAYQQLERVLSVRRTRLGPDHPSVATALNDMGNSAHSLGQLSRARRQLEQALALRRQALGDDHLRTAHTLNNLAIVLGDMDQHEVAARHARQAVAVTERAVGRNHVELAGPLNTLGDQLIAMGQSRPAWEAYARGLAILEHKRGKDHVSVAPLVENLARMLVQLGQLDQGIAYIDRAFRVRSVGQGEAHPKTINAMALRGSFNLQGKRFDAAAKDFERQRDLARKAFGDHPETAQAEYNIAVALEQAGKLDAASRQYRVALSVFEKAAPGHRLIANVWRGLGDVSVAKGALRQAEQHYQRAVVAAEASGHGLADMLHLQGQTSARRGRHAEAAKALERAVTIRAGGDVALLALAELDLARVLWAGRLDRGRARKLARHARGLFVSAGSRAEDNVKEVDVWLRGK